MYSFSNLEPVCCSMSASNYCFLTSVQVSLETGTVVWYSHFFKNFPQFVIHIGKGFHVVDEAEVEFPCFLYDPVNAGNLISGSSAFSKSVLYIWKFLVHILSKPSLENFDHYLVSVWNKCNCAVVWTFFDIALLWNWKSSDVFQSCGHCFWKTTEFSKFAGILSAAL